MIVKERANTHERGKEKQSYGRRGFHKSCLPRAGRKGLGDRWNTPLRRVSPHPVIMGNTSFWVGCS